MTIIINWLLSGLAVFAASYLLPGVHVNDFTAALVAALIIGIFNAILKPILIILTLPITILTLGLFTFVIQALLIMLADKIVPGFSVEGFIWALVLSIVLTLINSIIHRFSST
jgi:putative membrane protein